MPELSSHPDPAGFSSVVQMLARAAATSPSHEALVCGTVRLTYGEYASCVAGLAAELGTMGAKDGRVAIVFGNSIEYCIALMGGWAAGAQVAPINPLLTADEIGPLLEDIEASAIIYDQAVAALIEPLAERFSIPHRIRVQIGDEEGLLRWRHVAGTIRADLIPKAADYSLLLYTGGTTGIPKGVNLTHHSGVSGIVQFNTLVPTRKGIERLLCVGPLSHVYSLQVAMSNMLNCGGTMVILPRYSAEATLDMLEQERITILVEMPADAILFDPSTLKVEAVREEEKYKGVRLTLRGHLGRVVIPVYVDIGFGDRVYPAPSRKSFPKPAARSACGRWF